MARLDFDWGAFDRTVAIPWMDGKEYEVRKLSALTLDDNSKALAEVADDATDEDKLVALADYLLDEAGFPAKVAQMPLAFRGPFFESIGVGNLGE